MIVENEIKSAKRLWRIGLIIVIVSSVFILASVVLSLYDYADIHGWERFKSFLYSIYRETQFPILGTIWSIAARPYFYEPLHLHNLWFFGEVVVCMIGLAMMGVADKNLRDIADAAFKAKQQHRQDQFQKKEQEKLKEREREKDKDLS
ncbi:hypothetical protein A9978_17325 [Pseudomonas sp. UMC65]|uniref:hypothetical protein n=1 Tax=unclassified Pseudomonas TaxID=196821 RepID=UPI0015FF3795|nr:MULTISPECIES: hypothetical protein [unclassified Pseudomonas]MBB1614212.1 hypothetical protein [Pseudomonas sp. UMC65]MBB1617588.1 hypothetical protein [Pseudomonas sp. UME65]